VKHYFAIIVTFIAAFIPNLGHASELESLKYAYWKNHVPNVVICNNLQIDKEKVEKAISHWRERGEKLGNVMYKKCNERPDFGEIAIYPDSGRIKGGEQGKAQTTRYKGTNSLAYARIWLNDNVWSVELIEHELGHGLGYNDIFEHGSNNIMSTHKPLEY
jgi:hypothetical protein